MLMKLKDTAHMVEIVNLQELFNPYETHVTARLQWGEEEQDAEPFEKSNLCFLSGERLPLCWMDSHYRDKRPEIYDKPEADILKRVAGLNFTDAQVPPIY